MTRLRPVGSETSPLKSRKGVVLRAIDQIELALRGHIEHAVSHAKDSVG